MVRKILIVTATETEASVFRDIETPKGSGNSSLFEGTSIDILVTGIGTMACSRSLLNHFNKSGHPDLAINAGIAGSFNLAHGVGSVSIVSRDCLADFGIDDKS